MDLINAAAKQRIDILERELAEATSLIARLKADLRCAMAQGFSTKVYVPDELTAREIDLVYNAYTAGYKKGSVTCEGHISYSRDTYITKLEREMKC